MTRLKGFNAQRCFLIIRNEIFLNRVNFLIFPAVVWGILLLKLIIAAGIRDTVMFSGLSNGLFIFISGLIIFEKSFKDLHAENKAAAWLTLPASLSEKYVSRLAFSITASVLGIIILFFLFYVFCEAVTGLFSRSFHLVLSFDLFNKEFFLTTVRSIILMSPFHLGYLYFKRNAFGKTFLCLIGYLLLLGLISVLAIKILFPGGNNGFLNINFPPEIIPNLSIQNDAMAKMWSVVKWTASIAFWYLLAPLCWVIGYIRLRETEA